MATKEDSVESFTRKRFVVLGATVAAMVIAGALAWLAMSAWRAQSSRMNLLPVREVVFTGELSRVDAEELKRLAGGIRNAGMLGTDLNEVKSAVKQVEWVRDAEVRRRFPGTLVVAVREQTPFARWVATDAIGDPDRSFLVNTDGDVFEAETEEALPLLGGPDGSAREVLAGYQAFRALLAPIARDAAEVRLSPRRAWQVKLAGGAILELGRNDAPLRLSRFVRAFPQVPALQEANAHVDLRYQAGLSVRGTAPAPIRANKTAKRT